MEWALETVPDNVFNSCSVYDLEIAFLKETFYNDKIECIVEQKKEFEFLHKIQRVQDKETIALLSTKWR